MLIAGLHFPGVHGNTLDAKEVDRRGRRAQLKALRIWSSAGLVDFIYNFTGFLN